MKTQFNSRFIALLLFIIAVAFTRFFTVAGHTPFINFTPIGAIALFGGAYFKPQWKAILFTLLILFISDLVINVFIYGGQYGIMYEGWYVVYSVIALTVFFGKWLLQKVN